MSAPASRCYKFMFWKGSAQCLMVSTCVEPKTMQNFPINIALTSLCSLLTP